MQKLKVLILSLVIISMGSTLNAQKMLPTVYDFSKDKTAFVNLTNGDEVEGQIIMVDRKNGLFKSFELQKADGQILKIVASDIVKLYAAPASWDNQRNLYSFLNDASKWDNNDFNVDYFKSGYVYFEQVEVDMGRKKRNMLLQLLNPSFSSKVKVYNDPWISDLSLNKNVDVRPFYVKDGGFPAFKLSKEAYKANFVALFGECKIMLPRKENAQWKDFGKHLYSFTHCK